MDVLGWVPVIARLPEPGRDVLVSDCLRCGVAQFAWGKTYDVTRQEWYGTAIVPMYWMPLPELPASGEATGKG
jgi:hypothetical protein